jgi:hypothetical protein
MGIVINKKTIKITIPFNGTWFTSIYVINATKTANNAIAVLLIKSQLMFFNFQRITLAPQ